MRVSLGCPSHDSLAGLLVAELEPLDIFGLHQHQRDAIPLHILAALRSRFRLLEGNRERPSRHAVASKRVVFEQLKSDSIYVVPNLSKIALQQ